jgi:quinol monooxygenase YgiN
VSGYDRRPYKTLTVGAPPPAPNGRTIVVVTHVDVSPDPRVPVLLKRLAEASRQDQGNLRFDVLQHTMRANHFTVIEAWQSQSALDAHVAAAHTREYRDEVQPNDRQPARRARVQGGRIGRAIARRRAEAPCTNDVTFGGCPFNALTGR